MKEIAELVKAISSLLWPIFALIVLYLFKNQIGYAINRLKKGKICGQEFELKPSVQSLYQSVSSLSNVEELEENNSAQQNETFDEIQLIIHEATKSPKASLILLATAIEKENREMLASIGKLEGKNYLPITQSICALNNYYGLPKHISDSLKLFWKTRNELIHGIEIEDQNLLSTIDSGITILKSLRTLPRETHRVYLPGITIYSDPQCKHPINNAKGVILESTTSGGTTTFKRIFPSTKTHFKKGKKVAWEWSSKHTFNAAWYKDPDTSKICKGWDGALEFTGRHLDEI